MREKGWMNFSAAVMAVATFMGAASGMSASGAPETRVLVHPQSNEPLLTRVEWAFAQASASSLKGDFWVGYSVRRLMGKRSFIGTCQSYPPGKGEPTLEMVISRRQTDIGKSEIHEPTIRETAEMALKQFEKDGRHEEKVEKDIAIVMRYSVLKNRQPVEVTISNLTLPVDLRGLPLIWIGSAENPESIEYLDGLYREASGEEAREHLVEAVSIHQSPRLVVPFLENVLTSDRSDSIREEAVTMMGEQDDLQGMAIMKKVATSDPSSEVRESAVWGLSEMERPEAEDLLIDLALNLRDHKTREEAVMALAEKASKKTIATLGKIAFDDRETEIQKQAVYAFADLPETEALPFLIKIAKTHSNPEIRKAAIYELGDSENPEATKALADILKSK